MGCCAGDRLQSWCPTLRWVGLPEGWDYLIRPPSELSLQCRPAMFTSKIAHGCMYIGLCAWVCRHRPTCADVQLKPGASGSARGSNFFCVPCSLLPAVVQRLFV